MLEMTETASVDRILEKRIPSSLMVRMQIGSTLVKNSLENSQNVRNRPTL